MSESVAPEQGVDIKNESGSGSFTIPNAAGVVQEGQAPDFKSMIPQEYQDKTWAKETKDIGSMFKQFDDLQSMIGKKPAGVPQETSSQEEWDKFYNSIGRPENIDGYEIKYPDKLAEGMTVNETEVKEFKEFAHKTGLTQKQVQALVEFDLARQTAALEQYSGQTEEGIKQANTDFDELVAKIFGDRQETVISNGKKLINQYVPDSLKEHIAGLDNKSLVSLAAVLDGISKDYIGEHNVENGNTIHTDSKEEIKTQYFNLLNQQKELIEKNRGADFTGEAAAMQKQIDQFAKQIYG